MSARTTETVRWRTPDGSWAPATLTIPVGTYDVRVGTDSDDIVLRDTITVR